MSRNFELLQQAGWDEGMFSEAPRPEPKEASAKPTKPTWPRLSSSEMARFARRVFLDSPPPAPRVVVFSGLRRKVGCSKLCAFMARLLAEEAQQRVCAVDGNFGAPSLHVHFDSSNQPGLAEALLFGQPPGELARQVSPESCWLLSYGQKRLNGQSGASSLGLRNCLDALRDQFDFVLVDSPSLSAGSQAIRFARCSDGAILVADCQSTSASEASNVKRQLDRARVPLLGVVMTN
ncbi:MAG TPA: cellulose synthase operon protein YhjQ/BcsQ [Verrucomicrobiae bacterium]|nr:cellulose synthase operon protein YhjQ/BcsQ [Verrucomicrobiae bacterium]